MINSHGTIIQRRQKIQKSTGRESRPYLWQTGAAGRHAVGAGCHAQRVLSSRDRQKKASGSRNGATIPRQTYIYTTLIEPITYTKRVHMQTWSLPFGRRMPERPSCPTCQRHRQPLHPRPPLRPRRPLRPPPQACLEPVGRHASFRDRRTYQQVKQTLVRFSGATVGGRFYQPKQPHTATDLHPGLRARSTLLATALSYGCPQPTH